MPIISLAQLSSWHDFPTGPSLVPLLHTSCLWCPSTRAPWSGQGSAS